MKTTDKKHLIQSILGLMVLVLVLLYIVHEFRQKKEPLKIGLTVNLTGRASGLGTSARSGAMLAVEQINRGGGINGRVVELITRDNKNDAEETLRVVRELIEEKGGVALVGPNISSLSMKITPFINKKQVVMATIGSITAELTGRDDYIIRAATPLDRKAPIFAAMAYDDLHLRNMAIVLDLSNISYSGTYSHHFSGA